MFTGVIKKVQSSGEMTFLNVLRHSGKECIKKHGFDIRAIKYNILVAFFYYFFG
jgi:hypothetical protein